MSMKLLSLNCLILDRKKGSNFGIKEKSNLFVPVYNFPFIINITIKGVNKEKS